MRVIVCIFFIFSVLFSTSLYAEDFKLEHYSRENGLSHNSVRHIVQDKFGLLWLGTFKGLNSFDGHRFTPYLSNSKSRNGIQDDDITALILDQDSDVMWIGTRGGLTKFNLKTHQFTTFLHEKDDPNSIPDSEIRSIYIDKFKRIWVGTKDHGLCILDEKNRTFLRVPLDESLYIKSIFDDLNGHIWIGSFETGGISKITLGDNGEILNIQSYDLSVRELNVVNPYIYFICQDYKSDLFVGTREGLFKWNKQDDIFELQPIHDSIFRETIGPYFTCIARAPDGKYWLGTIGGIVVCNRLEDISEGDFQWYYTKQSEKTSLVDNSISALYFDNSGLLWIGTDNGLDKYDPFRNQFKTINSFSLIVDGRIPRISDYAKTYDDKLIVATHNSGLFIKENNQFKKIKIVNNDVSGIYTPDGKIFYCGLWSGKVVVYNYIKNTSKLLDVGFKPVPVFAFKKLANGHIIMGSHGSGAVILKPHGFSLDYTLQRKFPNIAINQVTVSNDGLIWIATENGVITFNPENNQSKVYVSKDGEIEGLTSNSAKAVCIDDSGTVWVATRMGLNFYQETIDDFMHVKRPSELRENWITDIVKGKDGLLWLNFNNGQVGRFNPHDNSLKTYDVGSGNRLDVFSNKGFLLYKDSVVYITGKDEIIYFTINGLKENLRSDPPFITEVKVQNKMVLPGEQIKGQVVLDENINYSRLLELEYVNRNFSLSFSSPSYANSRLNKYEYMLEGFDEEWITVDGNSTTVQYTNLYPQEYTFKIRAANSSGYWSELSTYEIKIHPPFWLTPKAIILIFLILIGVIYFVYRQLRKSWMLKHALLVEKVHREREEKLNEEKLRFFTNISHEFRTPISLIIGPAKQLAEDGLTTDFQKSRVQLILQNSNRLFNLVNQLLDFRKAQNGELKLKVSKTDVITITQTIFLSFEGLAKEKSINYHFNCEYDEISGWIDTDKYDKILCNLLSNALKFTQKYGNVSLFLGLKNTERGVKKLIVEVKDDGIGIPEESQKKIFTRFFQVESSKEEHTGTGIGLSLVKSLIKVHKSDIQLHSTPGKGSVFTLEIPIDKEFYDENEIFDYEKVPVKSMPPLDQKVEKKSGSTEFKEKVLIIDDNQELRDYIADCLSENYRVYKADNGETGLQICRQIKPIICIADVMMPVMDGFELCRTLKNDERISHIPVILLTALSNSENQIKGYKLGADDYLTKPFDPSLLNSRIQNIVETRSRLKKTFSGDIESSVDLLTHSPVDEEFLNKLTSIINSNLREENLTSKFLCSTLGISSSSLYRKVKELTDLSPNEFIRTLRLKKAVQLLRSGRNNVSEVSDMVGFNDPYYFSRCFKKQFGFPPSDLL
ncbi:two-component regulator propeller domain-containing protein [Thermophagus sp. OGC60D27]|uniref:two-component regulator propeller domain-containing protein n=1 Tax=Thermophagus sp. OGC60D27 TaxID=3458415 RepID=UPI004038211C